MNPIIAEIRKAKRGIGPRFLTAYCTAARPIAFARWNGRHPVEENTEHGVWPEGTVLKIVMTSRFGDVGLTDRLDATTGYHVRVYPDRGEIRDIRWSREEGGHP